MTLSALQSNEMHKTKVSVYFSKTGLFIDRPHLVTCHNIRRSNTKLMFKALSLTDKCRGRVSPGAPASCPFCEPPAAKCCKEHNRPDTIHTTDSLSSDYTRTHLESWQTG